VGLVLGWTGILALMLVAFVYHSTRLRNLVKMCAWSKTVQWQGEWMPVETYLEKQFDVAVTHSMSPEETAKFTNKTRALEKP
jgi:hypothetical protein